MKVEPVCYDVATFYLNRLRAQAHNREQLALQLDMLKQELAEEVQRLCIAFCADLIHGDRDDEDSE
jgi:hypothetical protein